jgi:hypothetical protein
VQDLTGDVARGLQVQDTVHDVADLARAAERRKPADGAAAPAAAAVTVTTWPPYRAAISPMARWVSQKNPARPASAPAA